MNLFILDKDLQQSIQALDDKRIIKMVLETAQILCTVLSNEGLDVPYRPTHKNHPVTKWVGSSKQNLIYTWNYFNYILDEYQHRFSKRHKCADVQSYLHPYISQVITTSDRATSFENCSSFKNEEDVIQAYRKTMVNKWASDKRSPNWTKRNKPVWGIE